MLAWLRPTLRVCALYPDLMNIYADRGNLLLLERRCEWRGIGFELHGAGLGEPLDPDAHDLFYIGGGQDRDQALCAQDLATVKRDALHAAAARGAVVLGVCGGYQLLGHAYELGDERLPGRRPRRPRDGARGRAAADRQRRDRGRARRPAPRVLAGFENHGGRTHLGAGRAAAGPRARGPRQQRRSRLRGRPRRRHGPSSGTYLHGPLLPKNAWFADWLIATALGLPVGALAPLDDALEDAAHAGARRAAGVWRVRCATSAEKR